jgi:low affinity Fe/Cu permease
VATTLDTSERNRLREQAQGERRQSHRQNWFGKFSRWTAHITGQPYAFVAAAALILGWAVSGPLFGFGDTWQLVINTTTTIITFLMVFLIQSTQNRDAIAMHLKLDEIIRAVSDAHNTVLDLEDLEEGDLDGIRKRYEALAQEARDEGEEDPVDESKRTSTRAHSQRRRRTQRS